MTTVQVDSLEFRFPKAWQVSKYDDWSFYHDQFMKMRDGIQAVDLLAIDPQKTVWFIEAKDFRVFSRTNPSCLAEAVAGKVFDTLAAMLPTKLNGRTPSEIDFAAAVLTAKALRVIFHLEQPKKHSALRPRAINPVDVLQKLRRLVRAIDPHPLVVEIHRMHTLAWSVS